MAVKTRKSNVQNVFFVKCVGLTPLCLIRVDNPDSNSYK